MSAIVNGLAVNYDFHTKYKPVERDKDEAFIDSASRASDVSKSEKGTVMTDYYQKKPQYKMVQEKRVAGGYAVMSSLGIEAEDLENMSMDEFKHVMSGMIAAIPHHISRPFDEETVLISADGWENMKKDPDYAAWVLGYLKEDRSVRNPFFGMGDKGCFSVQNFGASPAEYHGLCYSKIYGGTASGARTMYNTDCSGEGIVTRGPQADLQPPADYNLWEERRKARKKKQKELLEADVQAKYLQKKRIDKMYENRDFEHQRILREYNKMGIIRSNDSSNRVHASLSSVSALYESSFMITGMDGLI